MCSDAVETAQGRLLGGRTHIRDCPRRIKAAQASEVNQVRRGEVERRRGWGAYGVQSAAFQFQVGLDVDLEGFQMSVTQNVFDGDGTDAGHEQMHSFGVPENMRADRPSLPVGIRSAARFQYLSIRNRIPDRFIFSPR